MKTVIILIRHAQAKGNVNRTFQGRSDEALSETGEKQLAALTAGCRDLPFTAAYSSPLARAVKTAEAAIGSRDLKVQPMDGLLEINGGDWEGRSWDSFPNEYPEQNDNWYHHPSRFQAPNGEPMIEVQLRMVKTIGQIAKNHPGETVCVVSHGCAINCYLTWAKGIPFEALSTRTICDNTAINRIEYDADGNCTVVQENDVSHLDPSIHTRVSSLWANKKE